MTSDINLLGNKGKSRDREKKSLLLFRVVAVSGIVIVAVLAVVLFLVKASYVDAESKKQADVNASLSAISLLQSKLVEVSFINDRLRQIGVILAKRSSLDSTISQITQQLPPNISIKDLSIDKKTVTLSLTSPSLFSLDQFLNGMFNLAENKQTFKDVKITNLSVSNAKDRYIVSVELETL